MHIWPVSISRWLKKRNEEERKEEWRPEAGSGSESGSGWRDTSKHFHGPTEENHNQFSQPHMWLLV